MYEDIPFCGNGIRFPIGPRPGLVLSSAVINVVLPAVQLGGPDTKLGGVGFGK